MEHHEQLFPLSDTNETLPKGQTSQNAKVKKANINLIWTQTLIIGLMDLGNWLIIKILIRLNPDIYS